MCVCQWSDFFLQPWNRIGWIMLTSMVPAAPWHHQLQKSLLPRQLWSLPVHASWTWTCFAVPWVPQLADFLWREVSHDESIFGWFGACHWFFDGYSTMEFHVGYHETTCFFFSGRPRCPRVTNFRRSSNSGVDTRPSLADWKDIFRSETSPDNSLAFFLISHGKISTFFFCYPQVNQPGNKSYGPVEDVFAIEDGDFPLRC